jgi:hypothetical protein
MPKSSKSRRAKPKAAIARKKPVQRAGPAKSAAWTKRVTGRITILVAPTLAKIPWAVHGFSTRKGGASKLVPLHSKTAATVLNLGFTEWDKRETV